SADKTRNGGRPAHARARCGRQRRQAGADAPSQEETLYIVLLSREGGAGYRGANANGAARWGGGAGVVAGGPATTVRSVGMLRARRIRDDEFDAAQDAAGERAAWAS